MLLGVVSDTHGHLANARAAVGMLETFAVEAVLHCGDVGSEAIVPLFAAWPTHFVFGNVDGGSVAAGLTAAMEKAGLTCHGRFGSFQFAGMKIALLHGDDGRLLNETIKAGEHQLVCHGHTHVPRLERVGSTLVLNPGALYRAAKHTIAIIELPALQAQIITV